MTDGVGEGVLVTVGVGVKNDINAASQRSNESMISILSVADQPPVRSVYFSKNGEQTIGFCK